jgi:hypothetical protein
MGVGPPLRDINNLLQVYWHWKQMPRLICAGKTLLISKGGTSLVKGEDTIPGGGVGAERLIMADGVFGSGGTHLGLFKILVVSSIILSWEDNSFDFQREDRFWRGVVAGG